MAVAREHSQGPIQAYAKLQGENFVYYVQTLELMLGRRVEGYTDVQVDLGPSRTISRQHAKIVYEFQSRRFMLHPLGKNGVVVNGQHYTPGAVIPLDTKYAAVFALLPPSARQRSPALSLAFALHLPCKSTR